ncbi:SMP-30/gluconolactonase/LRE family protein [Dactylosporangium salmoneum]|uniref:SMP-30/gluconolactonase/LRE family protein n=1 Tax=Dactylosporangium salmoneum TaxID=53361 RepID=A0ABN3FGU6_9ACTN
MLVEAVHGHRCELGESPRWDAARGELVWTDVPAGRVHRAGWDGRRLDAGTVAEYPGPVPLCLPGVVVAVGPTLWWLDPVAAVELPVPPGHRCNDGGLDRRGRLLVGSMAGDAAAGQGALWSVEPGSAPRRLIGAATVPNGLCFSPDGGLLYWVDSGPRTLSVFEYDQGTGELGRRRARWRLGDGAAKPDGMAADPDGMLWIALWDGGRVVRVDPATGATLATVELPADKPTACCFGGPGRDVLFVTTAARGSDDPRAGLVYAVRL